MKSGIRSGWARTVVSMVMLMIGITGLPHRAWAGAIEDANRQIVRAFYELAFTRHEPVQAADLYIGATYIQHNPRVPNGAGPFKGFFEKLFRDNPSSTSDIKRLIADGDIVAVHSHSRRNAQDRGRAIVDIFRVENGKIVEHWDVIQDVPDGSANGNTMFDGTNAGPS